ncbi:hypothetical protein ACJJTC_016432 [Scirpophaga incertulas]
MFRKCCIPECTSLRQDVKFHVFPNDDEMKRKWLQCIGSEKNCETRNMYVCHKHFEQKFANVTNHLKKGAYPTLFSRQEILSGKPMTGSVKTDASHDHTYSRKRHIDHTYAKPYGPLPKKDKPAEVYDSCELSAMQDHLVPIATFTAECNTPDTQHMTIDQQQTVSYPTTSLDVATGKPIY